MARRLPLLPSPPHTCQPVGAVGLGVDYIKLIIPLSVPLKTLLKSRAWIEVEVSAAIMAVMVCGNALCNVAICD